MDLYTPRKNERVFLNNQDVSEVCIGYNESISGALIYIFLPLGKKLKTTQGTHYRTWVYGELRVEKPDEAYMEHMIAKSNDP